MFFFSSVFGGVCGWWLLWFLFLGCRIARTEKEYLEEKLLFFSLIFEVELLLTYFDTRPQMCIR